MKLLFSILLFLIVGLIGCSDNQAGTASETETSVSGLIVDAGGNPAPNVAISVRPDFPEATLREGSNYIPEIKSDNSGAFEFSLKESGPYILHANSSKVGLAKRFQISKNQKTVELTQDTLKLLSSLAGIVYDKEGTVLDAQIILSGTEHNVTTQNGFFEFKELAEFVYDLTIRPEDNTYLTKVMKIYPLGDTIKIYLDSKIPKTSNILDDFEDGDLIGALSSQTKGSEWWTGGTGGGGKS